MNRRRPTARRRLVGPLAAALLGFGAPPVLAAPSEGCTKGPAEALRSGDGAAAEDALRKALADSACGPVAPDLRLRLAQVLADNHDNAPGPACEAMGLFRRIAAESEDALLKSDAAARADRLGPICAGEVPDDETGGDAPGDAAPPSGESAEAPGAAPAEPLPPPREPGAVEWGLVAGSAGLMALGGALVVASQFKLADRDEAHRDYLAAPFGSPAEREAVDRFEDEQTTAQILLGSGVAAIGVATALGITAVAMWPGSADTSERIEPVEPTARLMIGPTGVGLVGRW